MKRRTELAIFLLLLPLLSHAQTHSARGVILSTDPAHHSLTISCDAIPGYMDAMEMPFAIHDSNALAPLKAGMQVSFTIAEAEKSGRHTKRLYAENIQILRAANLESEPLQAGQLTALHDALSGTSSLVQMGQPVPDFVLTDQVGQAIHLSQFQGKAVALTFGYSRCPNPEYCFRLSNNLALVERRFRGRAGKDFVLLTIAIDPEHDQGAALAKYAETWHADPAVWHFLTGPLPEIHHVANMFGMNFWSEEGLVTHTMHTVIIDRNGRLAANLEGNRFSAAQLGDLLQTVMDGR